MKPVRNLLVPVILLLLLSCKKESFTSSGSAQLTTSSDSLHFDTVFTSTGSVSQVFTIVNENNKGIHISSVRMGGGTASSFRMNVDGIAGSRVDNIDIGAHDSIYVFVTVTIDPSAAPLPSIIRDSIEISYNGNTEWVQLDAYGRNAHFLRNTKITSAETWTNDLPYVILGTFTVDTNAILTISKGCRIFLHADAPFIVNGSLQVNGEKEDSARVVFSSDRLDEPYRDFPAGYPGIIFTGSSKNNQLNYAIIKNSYQAIVAIDPSPGIKLSLSQVVIDNAYDAGIIGINTSINAVNVLVSNCGKDIVLVKGGNYNFTHCTAVSSSNNFIQHRDPVLVATDYLGNVVSPLNAVFRNCIFWGEQNGLVENEVVVSRQSASGAVNFDQVLWRVQTNPAGSTINSALNNVFPLFDSSATGMAYRKYRLTENSPARNRGTSTPVTIDLDGNPRPVGLPDLGAFEKQ